MMNFQKELKLRKDIGTRLKSFRESLRMNQDDFAKKLNLEQHTISRIENGSLPIHDYEKYILTTMGCSIDWLITDTISNDQTANIELSLLREKYDKLQEQNMKLQDQLSKLVDKLVGL